MFFILLLKVYETSQAKEKEVEVETKAEIVEEIEDSYVDDETYIEEDEEIQEKQGKF